MLLSDRDIKSEIAAGRVGLEPYAEDDGAALEHRRPARPLLPGLREPPLSPHRPGRGPVRTHPRGGAEGDEPFILHPGEFALGSIYEVVTLPDDIAARVEGKSSLGRLGLLTHSTAGFIDPGFSGHVTLELSNVATLPIKLWPGMKIGQLCFFRLTSPARSTRTARRVTAPATRASEARRRAGRTSTSTAHRSEPLGGSDRSGAVRRRSHPMRCGRAR